MLSLIPQLTQLQMMPQCKTLCTWSLWETVLEIGFVLWSWEPYIFFFRTCPGFSISFSLDFLVKICWLNWRYTELEGGVVLSWCCVERGRQGGCGATWLMLSVVSPSAPRSPQWQTLCHCTSWLFDVIWPCSGTTVLVFRNLVFSSQAPLPMDF